MDKAIAQATETVSDFARDSKYLIRKCNYPDAKGMSDCSTFLMFLEFQKIAFATLIGFLIMGFIGFFVKLIHIPVNNFILGA